MLGPHEWLSEMYEVEKTIEVVGEVKGIGLATVQVRAIRDTRTGEYQTRAAILRQCEMVFADYEDPQSIDGVSEREVWVEFYLPWTGGNSADDVLNQALLWLRQRGEG